MKKVYLILIIFLLGVVLFFIPFVSVPVIPELRLKVIDRQGEKVIGIKVIQDWQHYLYESSNNKNQEISDLNGYVAFPERKIKISLADLGLGFLIEKIGMINPHANIEPFSSFRIEEYDSYSNYYRADSELPKEIVVSK